MKKITFALSEKLEKELSENPSFTTIYEEFQFYKEDSGDKEHPAPTRKAQQDQASVNWLFGRDRFDKINPEASRLDIQHVHVFTEYVVWVDDQGVMAQWDCTSDSYLIYSYFNHNDTHHYFLIDFMTDESHEMYEQLIVGYIELARNYKKSIVQPDLEKST